MGHTYAHDGKCTVCNDYTDIYCDSCKLWICPVHYKEVEVGTSSKIFCPTCFKKRKKAKTPIKDHPKIYD